MKIKSAYMQTHKVNRDELMEKMKSIIEGWKNGRFMPLTQKTWSVNSYIHPTVWYRYHLIHMREVNFSKMTSLIKS